MPDGEKATAKPWTTTNRQCAYCNIEKHAAAFPAGLHNECWSCFWRHHQEEKHPPKRRWRLRWPIYLVEV